VLSEDAKARTLQTADQFEILYYGLRDDLETLPPESTIIVREKQPWLDQQGRWRKVYGMSDGSASMNRAEVGLLWSLLEEAGIEFEVRNEFMNANYPIAPSTMRTSPRLRRYATLGVLHRQRLRVRGLARVAASSWTDSSHRAGSARSIVR